MDYQLQDQGEGTSWTVEHHHGSEKKDDIGDYHEENFHNHVEEEW